jgi:hypothetical protein
MGYPFQLISSYHGSKLRILALFSIVGENFLPCFEYHKTVKAHFENGEP